MRTIDVDRITECLDLELHLIDQLAGMIEEDYQTHGGKRTESIRQRERFFDLAIKRINCYQLALDTYTGGSHV
jgi:hypothetical protein